MSIITTLTLVYPVKGFSQDDILLNLRSSIQIGWGKCLDVAFYDNYAFVATDYSGLVVVDCSPELDSTRYITSIPSVNSTSAVCIADSLCIFNDNNGEITIMDMVDERNADIISSYPLDSNVLTFGAVNHMLYVVEHERLNYQIRSININDPYDPMEWNDPVLTVPVNNMAVAEGGLYLIASSNELLIYHLIQVEDPTFVGSYYYGNEEKVDLCYDNFKIYLLESNAIKVIDVSNIFNPELVLDFELEGLSELKKISVKNDIAYVLSDSQRIVVNLENLELPLVYSIKTIDSSYANAIDIHNDTWINALDKGIELINISNPDSIYVEEYHFEYGKNNCALISGDYAYVPVNLRRSNNMVVLKILDISNPDYPQEMGMCRLENAITSLAIKDSLIIASWKEELSGFYVIDVSDPQTPVVLANYLTQNEIKAVYVEDNIVFMGIENQGLTAVDLSDANSPVMLDHDFNEPAHFGTCVFYEDYAYLGNTDQENSSLRVLDVSNQRGFCEVNSVLDIGYSYGFAIKDNILYSAAGNQGLNVIDIRIPEQPRLLENYDYLNPRSVSIYGNYALIQTLSGTLELLNISDGEIINYQEMPYETPGIIKQVNMVDGIVYVSDTQLFSIYEIESLDSYSVEQDYVRPEIFTVSQAYPNPFNPVTSLDFQIPEAGLVTFTVFNTLGREITQSQKFYPQGSHRFLYDIETNRNGIGSGMYFIRIQYGSQAQVRPVSFLK